MRSSGIYGRDWIFTIGRSNSTFFNLKMLDEAKKMWYNYYIKKEGKYYERQQGIFRKNGKINEGEVILH